jgi:hypothetical protein
VGRSRDQKRETSPGEAPGTAHGVEPADREREQQTGDHDVRVHRGVQQQVLVAGGQQLGAVEHP